jgi:cell division FtsZ-interacting protein ZapD
MNENKVLGGLVFVTPRDLTYSEAKIEIIEYLLKKLTKEATHISELAENLQIDMDLIDQILDDMNDTGELEDMLSRRIK